MRSDPVSLPRFLIFALLVVALAFIQSNPLFIFGVKPNLVLAGLLALAFLAPSFLYYVFLVLIAVVVLRWRPVIWEPAVLATAALGLGCWWIRRWLTARDSLNLLGMSLAATVIFYIIVDPSFAYRAWISVLAEAIYNSAAALILFYIFRKD